MLKVVGTIVGEDRILIGFMVQGKKKEFNEIGDEIVTRALKIDVMRNARFKNRQIMVTPERGVIEGKNFRMNELPMRVLMNNKLVEVKNGIELTHRVVKLGEVVGFGVRFEDGNSGVYRYMDVLRLSRWYKPANYMIKKSATDKIFVAGKPNGIKIGELPEINITPKATEKEKKEYKRALPKELDILDVFEIVNNHEGMIINMPYTSYTPKNEVVYKESDEFTKLGFGEIAYPYISFNDTKMNLNTNFKQPGIVNVDINGMRTPIYTYVYKTRTIFSGPDSFMGQIGFAVKSERADEIDEFFKHFGGITKVTDKNIEKSVNSIVGAKDYKVYVVNNQKIDALSPEKVKRAVLSPMKLDEITKRYFIARAIVKYIGNAANGVLGQLKKAGVVEQEEKTRDVYEMFRGYSTEALEALEVAGVNIYDGNYTKLMKVEKDPMDEMFESFKDVEEKNEDISIEYFINGYELKKWTGKAILEDVAKEKFKLPKEVIEVVQKLESMEDDLEKLRTAIEIRDKYTKIVNKIKRIYWMHNAAMLISTNKESVHAHDKDKWEADLGKKGKAEQFICKEKGCEELRVVMTGITIK